MIKAKLLKPTYTQKEALMLLLHTDPGLDLQSIENVHYPYVRFRYRLTVGKEKFKFMKPLNKLVDCIIDRVCGSVYEAKGEPEYIEEAISHEESLETVTPMEQCYEIGHQFCMRQYISKAKLMFTPKIEIIEEDSFYKRFYVVECKDQEGRTYFIMVDAVDGGLSVLDHEKHIDELVKRGEVAAAGMVLDSIASDSDFVDGCQTGSALEEESEPEDMN